MIFRFKQRFIKHSTSRDMTEGNPVKLIFSFAIPVLLGNIVQNFYSMADSIIVGRILGTDALAAVGNTGPFTFLVLGFVFGLTSGFAVLTAQAYGSKDAVRLKNSVAMNIILNLIAAVVFTAVAIGTAKPLLVLVNTPESVLQSSLTYITIIYAGIGATILYNWAACTLRAVGDSRTPLYFLIFSSVLNIVLDIVLIKFANWGIAGAAAATVFAQALAGILSLVVMWKKYPELHVKKQNFAWNIDFASQHLKIGAPMAFQFSITAIGTIVLQGALNLFGPNPMAAYAAANKVEQLIAVAAGSFGVVMANYAGQNYGAGRIDRIKKGTRAGALLTVGFSLLSMAIGFLFPDYLTGLFMETGSASYSEIMNLSRQYLQLTCVFYPALFLIFIYRNVLQSIGKTFWPLMGGVFELITRTLCAFTLPAILDFAGICLAGPAAWFSAAIPLFIAYQAIIRRLLTPTEIANQK
ncbi:MAG: MATE family efflux transporter [Treponemataceae bacterium]|nr:MATE family efflux transporter [Treponemataceae bacterium]